jgi:hypothetical protein
MTAPSKTQQTTSHILMIRPAQFGFNEETAGNNAFQINDGTLTPAQVRRKAVAEFDHFVQLLRAAGVHVTVVQDTDYPLKTDAVFPNNWVSFHADGTVITYPMYSAVRRLERREEILNNLTQQFQIANRVQLEAHENREKFLEGTGSMILDRPNRIAYACISPRTDEGLLEEFCKLVGFESVVFMAVDGGKPIYHTNVMMALGETFVVICLETIQNQTERDWLLQKFAETQKEVIEISLAQMMAFAGNMLQVKNRNDEPILVMSEQAYKSLNSNQLRLLNRHTNLLYAPLYTIERYGGGSARCMMAEIFLPEKRVG